MTKEKPTPPRRTRSDAQLAQKRQSDRVTHRHNRAEAKQRMLKVERDVENTAQRIANIESSVTSLRDDLRAILYQLHQGQAPGSAVSRSDSHQQYAPQQASTQAFTGVSGPLNTHPVNQQPSPADAQRPQTLSASYPHAGLQVECRCGREHKARSECAEYSSFALLYHQTQAALRESPAINEPLPRNPALEDLLSRPKSDNGLALGLGSMIRHFNMANVETHLGFIFLAYRFMRWRLHPDEASLEDVPEWLRLTSVQESTLHPLIIDYIPWPTLRDYLCLNQRQDDRHNAELYMRSFRLKWPSSQQLLSLNVSGKVTLHPDFENVVCDINNWTMGSPWTDVFPYLHMHVGL
ncbi:bZIP transcription factor [Emericellopsis cladophorae]|uniref:BZIP transcription factor n=1 Tax=Emericellopsis cladophorae TaxID=2686198 RepID=A0A9P9Y0Y3_9HYPO|nr:bZIP transcription factor [Emericellopsis cladophorae]KAI6781345.1 bZIP transcription factor [Emericellopsis cladophorae]